VSSWLLSLYLARVSGKELFCFEELAVLRMNSHNSTRDTMGYRLSLGAFARSLYLGLKVKEIFCSKQSKRLIERLKQIGSVNIFRGEFSVDKALTFACKKSDLCRGCFTSTDSVGICHNKGGRIL
jgi:hypothetical protein